MHISTSFSCGRRFLWWSSSCCHEIICSIVLKIEFEIRVQSCIGIFHLPPFYFSWRPSIRTPVWGHFAKGLPCTNPKPKTHCQFVHTPISEDCTSIVIRNKFRNGLSCSHGCTSEQFMNPHAPMRRRKLRDQQQYHDGRQLRDHVRYRLSGWCLQGGLSRFKTIRTWMPPSVVSGQ